MGVTPWLVQVRLFLVRVWFGVHATLTPVERRRHGASRVGCRRGTALGRQAEVGSAPINEAKAIQPGRIRKGARHRRGWGIGCGAGVLALAGESLDAIICAS